MAEIGDIFGPYVSLNAEDIPVLGGFQAVVGIESVNLPHGEVPCGSYRLVLLMQHIMPVDYQ